MFVQQEDEPHPATVDPVVQGLQSAADRIGAHLGTLLGLRLARVSGRVLVVDIARLHKLTITGWPEGRQVRKHDVINCATTHSSTKCLRSPMRRAAQG